MVVLYLPLAFIKETYSAPKSTPDLQQTALLTAYEKPPREIFWKCCNLLLIKEYSLHFCQESLAWLGCTSPSYASPEPEKKIGTRQPKSALPHAPSHHLQGQSGDSSPGRLMAAYAWRVVGGCSSPVPSLAYTLLLAWSPVFLSVLPY